MASRRSSCVKATSMAATYVMAAAESTLRVGRRLLRREYAVGGDRFERPAAGVEFGGEREQLEQHAQSETDHAGIGDENECEPIMDSAGLTGRAAWKGRSADVGEGIMALRSLSGM